MPFLKVSNINNHDGSNLVCIGKSKTGVNLVVEFQAGFYTARKPLVLEINVFLFLLGSYIVDFHAHNLVTKSLCIFLSNILEKNVFVWKGFGFLLQLCSWLGPDTIDKIAKWEGSIFSEIFVKVVNFLKSCHLSCVLGSSEKETGISNFVCILVKDSGRLREELKFHCK